MATGVDGDPAANESYAEAQHTTTETGKPMVVMVSTDWCPHCVVMKKTVLPRVRERGLLRKVAFATVNPDDNWELAEKLIGGGPIPQLIMFRRTGNGWMRKNLIGGQTVETVEEFINDGLAKDAAEKNAPYGEKKTATTKQRPTATSRASTGSTSSRRSTGFRRGSSRFGRSSVDHAASRNERHVHVGV